MLAAKRCICGQVVIFVQDAEDPEKVHPLSASSPCFELLEVDGRLVAKKRHRDLGMGGGHMGGEGPVMVSHFATCTKIAEFRASRGEIEAGPDVEPAKRKR